MNEPQAKEEAVLSKGLRVWRWGWWFYTEQKEDPRIASLTIHQLDQSNQFQAEGLKLSSIAWEIGLHTATTKKKKKERENVKRQKIMLCYISY